MCGRFVRETELRRAADAFGVTEIACDLGPSFNIAPSQPIAVVMEQGRRRIVPMQWGLIPRWSKDDAAGFKMINARAETIHEKPAYRDAFRSRRCLIIADGFFEWREEAGKKQPVFIYIKDRRPFGMAGIYETRTLPDGTSATTCSIVTTEANAFMRAIHHRMPVILDPQDYDRWLDPANHDVPGLLALLKPRAAEDMASHDVSPQVNSPTFNAPECVRPWR